LKATSVVGSVYAIHRYKCNETDETDLIIWDRRTNENRNKRSKFEWIKCTLITESQRVKSTVCKARTVCSVQEVSRENYSNIRLMYGSWSFDIQNSDEVEVLSASFYNWSKLHLWS